MEEFKRNNIPSFGQWEFFDNVPFTQYFESAKRSGVLHYSTTSEEFFSDNDSQKPSYVSTTASLQSKELKYRYEQTLKEKRKQSRVSDSTEPVNTTRPNKAVDEDLYKIPPELLHKNTRRKKLFGFLSRCLLVDCVT